MNKAYCIYCGSKQPYTIHKCPITLIALDITFSYIEEIAFCDKCDQEIYVPELSDRNADARELAFYNTKLLKGKYHE